MPNRSDFVNDAAYAEWQKRSCHGSLSHEDDFDWLMVEVCNLRERVKAMEQTDDGK